MTGVQRSRDPSKTQEVRQMSKVRVVKVNVRGQIRLEGQGSRVSNTVSSGEGQHRGRGRSPLACEQSEPHGGGSLPGLAPLVQRCAS